MQLLESHSRLLSTALDKILGEPITGAVAFIRCLTPDIVHALVDSAAFNPSSWIVWCVADSNEVYHRTITADRAVELREEKGPAVLLLVDTIRAGAGMDGIYSAAREIDEITLFKEAIPLAEREVKTQLGVSERRYCQAAIKRARGTGRRFSISINPARSM